jgi:hypothetical protein
VVVNNFLHKKFFPCKKDPPPLLASDFSVPHFLKLLPDVMLPSMDPGIGWTGTAAEFWIAGPVSCPLDHKVLVETIVNLPDKLRDQGG